MSMGIYYIKNTKNNKQYIGSSKNIENRFQTHKYNLNKNKHGNIILQRAWNKYGKDSFEFGILEIISNINNLLKIEQKYLDKLPNLYNIADAGGGDTLSKHPERNKIISKIKKTLIEKNSKLTKEERKEKWSKPGIKNGMFGRTHTDEVKKKLSEIGKKRGKGKNHPCYGMKMTKEQKKKMSDFAKTRTGEKNSFYGKTHSKEVRKNLSNQKKEYNKNLTLEQRIELPQFKFVEIEGVIYQSGSDASKYLGVSAGTICHRIKSPNKLYTNYSYVNDKDYILTNKDRIKDKYTS